MPELGFVRIGAPCCPGQARSCSGPSARSPSPLLEGRYGGEHEAVFEERAVCAGPVGEVAEEGFEVDVLVEYALQVLQAL